MQPSNWASCLLFFLLPSYCADCPRVATRDMHWIACRRVVYKASSQQQACIRPLASLHRSLAKKIHEITVRCSLQRLAWCSGDCKGRFIPIAGFGWGWGEWASGRGWLVGGGVWLRRRNVWVWAGSEIDFILRVGCCHCPPVQRCLHAYTALTRPLGTSWHNRRHRPPSTSIAVAATDPAARGCSSQSMRRLPLVSRGRGVGGGGVGVGMWVN
jgi:hypothetical protein